ncbi:hypothetical protein Tco_0461921 [Tanacetum coccineum]
MPCPRYFCSFHGSEFVGTCSNKFSHSELLVVNPLVIILLHLLLSPGLSYHRDFSSFLEEARLNGVSLLLVFGIVLWAHSTFGSSSTQPPPSWCNLVLIPCIMLWFALFTALFACGWYTDVETSFIPKPSA